jgi:predicted O-methyltransferase YrrM
VISGLERVPVLERPQLIAYTCRLAERVPGNYAEFGVAEGRSARIILNVMPTDRKLYLFDSFEGLGEPWFTYPAGAFACNPPTFDDDRAEIIMGRFEDGVGPWARGQAGPLAFVHIDCDLYSATVAALYGVRTLLRVGTVILFDEIWGCGEASKQHEERAWNEFTARERIGYQWVAAGWTQAACVLEQVP